MLLGASSSHLTRWAALSRWLLVTEIGTSISFGSTQSNQAAQFRTALPVSAWETDLEKLIQKLHAVPTPSGLPRPLGHLLSGRENNESSHARLKVVTTRNLTTKTWNVRKLLDTEYSERSHRRTALIARELDRYGINIAAFAESRLSEAGSLTEHIFGRVF